MDKTTLVFANAYDAVAWASIHHLDNVNAIFNIIKRDGMYKVKRTLTLKVEDKK